MSLPSRAALLDSDRLTQTAAAEGFKALLHYVRRGAEAYGGAVTGVAIPAGAPHFVAAKEGTVVVQASGTGRFQTDYLEK